MSTRKRRLMPSMLKALIRLKTGIHDYISCYNSIQSNKLLYGGSREAVLILGNGPSLDLVSSSIFQSYPCISCNNFYLFERHDRARVIAHCIGENPLRDNSENRLMLSRSVDELGPETLWIHARSKKMLLSSSQESKSTKFNYYVPGLSFPLFKPSPTFLGYSYVTSLQLAITVALMHGFENIFLLGADHTWLASQDNWGEHFEAHETNYSRNCTYLEAMRNISSMYEIYYVLKDVSALTNSKIVNLTPGSLLDVFPFGDSETFSRFYS